MRSIATFACTVLVLLTMGCGQEREAAPPSEFFLPMGNVEAGRQAFEELACYSCHEVEGEPDLPAPVDDVRAPTIGGDQAGQSRERIANSIVSPQHEVAPPRGWTEEMVNYRSDMSVQQLLDLVAFVASKAE